MRSSKPYHLIFLLVIFSCQGKSDSSTEIKNKPDSNIEIICNCNQIKPYLVNEKLRFKKFNDDSFYTGKCKASVNDTNEITESFLNGRLLGAVTTYPSGKTKEELVYDSTGKLIKHSIYHQNGEESFELAKDNHTSKTSSENDKHKTKNK